MSQGGGEGQENTNTPWTCNSNSENSGENNNTTTAGPLESKTNSPVNAEGARGVVVEGGGGQSKSSSNPADHKGVNVIAGGAGAGAGGEPEHEMHIWTERERRKRMRCMFNNLHVLLPQLPAKTDKASIVEEAVNYIKNLQETLKKLQKQKLERMRGQTSLLPVDEPSPSASARRTTPATRESVLADLANSWNSQAAEATVPLTVTAAVAGGPPSAFQTWSAPNIVLSVAGDDAYISVCAPKQPGILTTVLFVLEKHRIEVVSAQVSSDQSRSMFMIHAHASGASSQFADKLMSEEIYKLAVSEMMLWLSN